ncbi:C2H2 type zinc finger domain-containing protein [Colletotrichum truncatum]|uniref:C2H2 type zinc finger domain-containing protein n=1 Tax=Colletotrichum truncatum TaxID=5467 RepID=A0ACC3ZE12_COLTU
MNQETPHHFHETTLSIASGLAVEAVDSSELRPSLSLGDITSDESLQFTSFEPFSGENSPFEFDGSLDYVGNGLGSGWVTPIASCANCITWGYQCQTAQECESQGRCIPCASLGCDCSFTESYLGAPGEGISNILDGRRLEPDNLQTSPREDTLKSSSDAFRAITGSNTSTPPPPKIGTSFSRDSTRILRQWLSSHTHHPYPSDEEKKILQHQTGLSKIQITNWLINARRRGKVQNRQRSISPYSGSTKTTPIDVPKRPGTPAPRNNPRHQGLNPLERWVDSPPEHEPATVTAIARAVASSHAGSSGKTGRLIGFGVTDDSYIASYINDEPARSLRSSASSAGTSSGGSFASAYSHNSSGSVTIPRPLPRGRIRQRRRPKRTSLAHPRNQYQCTFCTETFRTKHDWQRHEKSLHMPLERWMCSPDGPSAVNPETGQICCVFCGEVDPSQAHIDSHNPSACQERTFNRKDHLKQHLRLVHNAGLLEWPTKLWKMAIPDIRSRCGFCGALLDTWAFRADHLADHFKMGQDMANWKGDWGFEKDVLDMVENSVPPYLIEYERFSPFPYQASETPPESPRNAFGLLTLELNHFLGMFYENTGSMPDNDDIQLEACRIVFASKTSSSLEKDISAQHESWLRDLITSSHEITRKARFGPIRSSAEGMMSVLQIKGKKSLFEQCPCEMQLQTFVEARRILGSRIISDQELQNEACKIVVDMGKNCGVSPSDFVANWLINLIGSSTEWLHGFRARKQLNAAESAPSFLSPYTANVVQEEPAAPLTGKQALYAEAQSQQLNKMTTNNLRADLHDKGLKTRLGEDGSSFLSQLGNFDARFDNSLSPATLSTVIEPDVLTMPIPSSSPNELYSALAAGPGLECQGPESPETEESKIDKDLPPTWPRVKANYSFFNDANFNRWLALELRRWVAATMSPNNPNCHVPSDEELQHQARFIVFEE